MAASACSRGSVAGGNRAPRQDDATPRGARAARPWYRGGFVYRGAAIPALAGRYVFTDIARGCMFTIRTAGLVPGSPTPIEELRLLIDGEERSLAGVAGFANTCHGPDRPRVDARLGIDHKASCTSSPRATVDPQGGARCAWRPSEGGRTRSPPLPTGLRYARCSGSERAAINRTPRGGNQWPYEKS